VDLSAAFVFESIVRHADVEALEWYLAAGFLPGIPRGVARSGQVKFLELLSHKGYLPNRDHYDNIFLSYIYTQAVEGGLEVVKWLYNYGFDLTRAVANKAAMLGKLDILQWQASIGRPVPSSVCQMAAGHGQNEVIKWVVANKHKYDFKKCAVEAATEGRLKTLQLLASLGDLADEVYEAACYWGHLNIVVWLFEISPPHNISVCIAAAREGSDADKTSWLWQDKNYDEDHTQIIEFLLAN
jgi:hypothetical protein